MLTEQTLQSLKDYLKKEISELEDSISFNKLEVKSLYEISSPESARGIRAFKFLNLVRNDLRKNQKELQRLQKIQKAVKKDLAMNVKMNHWADQTLYNWAQGEQIINVFEEQDKKDDYQG